MDHRECNKLLEALASGTLSGKPEGEVQQHLASCSSCREELRLIRLARGVVQAACTVDEPPVPSPWFAGKVLQLIAQREVEPRGLWDPLAWIAARAIPLVATLAILLGILAYSELGSLTKMAINEEDPLQSAYVEPSSNWSYEVLASEAAAPPAMESTNKALHPLSGPSASPKESSQ